MEEPTDVLDVLRVRRLEVVDYGGVARVVLGLVFDDGGNNIALVTLHDPEGAAHVSLACDQTVAAVELVEDGTAVASFSSNRRGKTGLWLGAD